MKKLFLLSLLLFSTAAFSQEFQISGTILEKDTNLPLEAATVYVEKVSDSTLVSYTISDRSGSFVLEGKASENLKLLISYTGFQTLSREISLDSENLELGNLFLEPQSNELGEVMITANRAPVAIKNDTLEFNAGSFQTRPDANLEEVMKKLPGVEVDTQGNITVNGKPVSRILVNGKEFFGDDPKIATKNLPKEIIDKIQVVDTKTKAEEFTGKAGDPENKTINITLQEDKNKGYFARATVGGGTDERYEMSTIANYFKDDMRVSVLASSNNINSSGFTFDEVFDMMGRNARSISMNSNGSFGINGSSFGSNQGITKAETAGLNYVNEWNENKEASLNYFFGRNHTRTQTTVERENILPDSRYYYFSRNRGNIRNDSHRVNAALEYEPDTLTRISFTPRININNGFSNRISDAESFDETGELINSTNVSDNEEFRSGTFTSSLDVIRKFGSRGSYLRVNLSNSNDSRENVNNYFSESAFLDDDDLPVVQVQNQLIDEDKQENSYDLGATQRSVLAEKLFLDISYDFETSNANNKRSVYEFDETSQEYSIYNDLLSNEFEVKSNKHIPNAGLSYEGSEWRASAEVGNIFTSLKTDNIAAGDSFENNYSNLFLSANVRYSISRSTNVYINYRTNTSIPSINQLQPVPNLTNPLNIVVGNPDLNPTFTHSFYGGYRKFDMAKRKGFYTYASLTYSYDNVVPYATIDENLVRTTTYTNLDGAISSYLGAFYNKSYKEESREFRYRFGLSANYNKGVGYNNTVLFESHRTAIRPGISLSYSIDELFSINPGYEISFNHSEYNYGIGDKRIERFTNHTISLETTTYWPKNFVLGNDIGYNYIGNVSPGFKNTSLLWNVSLGYKFLDDDATLKVKVYDLLDDNVSTQRTVGDDFVQDTNNLVLERYFMLSFTYKISKFGGKDPNENGRRMRR